MFWSIHSYRKLVYIYLRQWKYSRESHMMLVQFCPSRNALKHKTASYMQSCYYPHIHKAPCFIQFLFIIKVAPTTLIAKGTTTINIHFIYKNKN